MRFAPVVARLVALLLVIVLTTPAHAAAARTYGITIVTDDDDRAPIAALGADGPVPVRVVVLVHGLDDPGWMWRDVIPALRAAGHVVARMEYPNDGPISDAADALAIELAALRDAGVRRVDLVAHSMGGLVSRDVLTRRAYYGGDGRGDGRYPIVDRLVMCGTPNHGSEMARLRAIAEIKEQITRTVGPEDGGGFNGGREDGAGEAAEDLLPGSVFLRRLNARPAPQHTRYTIIAGRMSPVGAEDVGPVADRLERLAQSPDLPAWLRRWAGRAASEAESAVDDAVRALGDGCVTLDSARLDGVEDVTIVRADHVSLIVRVLGDETPPSIPIILERLGR